MKSLRNLYLVVFENDNFMDLDNAVACIEEVTAKDMAKTFNENEGYSERDLKMYHTGYFIHEIDTVAQ